MTNVLLIVLDSVRARNTSLLGYERDTTSFLESFADRATLYTQARAPSVASAESHASMFTGFHAAEHRLKDVRQKLRPGHTIWEALTEQGYSTGVFSYNSYLTQAPIGLKDAFEVVESGEDLRVPFSEAFDPGDLDSDGYDRYLEFLRKTAQSGKPFQSLVNGLSQWHRTRDLVPESLRGYPVVPDKCFTDMFLEWQQEQQGPWAACINYMGAHSPYIPDAEHNLWATNAEAETLSLVDDHAWSFITRRRDWSDRKSLENLYDGCIKGVDTEVERLIVSLEKRGVLEDTLVVITSDHGEGFAEQGDVRPLRSVAHGNSGGPEEGILHVPLLVSYPGQDEHRRIERIASLTEFPRVVREVCSNSSPSFDLFVPNNGQVVASMFEFTEDDMDRLPDFVTPEDYRGYEYGCEIVYEMDDNGRILKTTRWNGEIQSFDCTTSGVVTRIDCRLSDTIESVFNRLEPVDITVGGTGTLPDEVYDRLEELGYR